MSQGKGPIFIRLGGTGRNPGWFGILLSLLVLAVLLVAGVWLFMIAATLLVLALPYLWWKKRKFQQQVAAMMAAQQAAQQAAYRQQTGADPAAPNNTRSGVVIEGEILHKHNE